MAGEKDTNQTEPKQNESTGRPADKRSPDSEDLETSGTPEESFRAAERMTAGPELNDHGSKAYDVRESTGRQATEEWKKKKHES